MKLKNVSSFMQRKKKTTIPEISEYLKMKISEIQLIMDILQNMGRVKKNKPTLACNCQRKCSTCCENCDQIYAPLEYKWVNL